MTRKRIPPHRVSKCTAENERWADQKIDKGLSPDVIAGNAKLTGTDRRQSTGTIYKIIEKNRQSGGRCNENDLGRGASTAKTGRAHLAKES